MKYLVIEEVKYLVIEVMNNRVLRHRIFEDLEVARNYATDIARGFDPQCPEIERQIVKFGLYGVDNWSIDVRIL